MMYSASSTARFLTQFVALALAILGWASVAAAAELPPRPDGPIYDGGDMLSASTEAQLDQVLRDYNRETGNAIIVATIPSLNGEVIEPYATDLFTQWGIGGEKRDTGLLLLISRDDRKMRIEIGYGLHPYFGGVMAGRVIRDTITPRFKEGNFDAGVTEGVSAILAHLENSPEDAIAIEEAAEAAEANRDRSKGGFPFGALIWLGFMFFFFVLPLIRGKRRRYRSKGKGPWGERRGSSGMGDVATNIILWEVGSAIARGAMGGSGGSGSFGGGSFGGGGGGFGGFGGGMSGGGGASGGW